MVAMFRVAESGRRLWIPACAEMTGRGGRGFTLVELVVALFVFGLLASAGVALLGFSVRAQGAAGERLDEIAAIRRVSAIMTADLAQATPRISRAASGAQQVAFFGSAGGAREVALAFTRRGWENATGTPRGSLQKVQYRLVGDRLERSSAPMVDGAAQGPPATIIRGVKALALRYRVGGEWRARWDATRPDALPRAVEVVIELAGVGPVRQVFQTGTGHMSFVPPAGERGAALLAVLLLVAVMAAISVVALEKLRLATSLAANGAALDQARAYAFGAEALALTRVGLLDGRATGTTTLAGGWNGRVTRLPIPNGLASIRVRDGGNCFNLNSLAQGIAATRLAVRPVGVTQFIALMRVIGIADPAARRVAAGLADWLDADSTPLPDGAEDSDYLRAQHPYRAANTLLAEVSELRAVSGVTNDIYRVLRPWVCALPTADLSPLNVNTLLPDQAPLVAMLIPNGLDVERARQIIVRRPPMGWDSVDAFWKEPALAALVPDGEVRGQPQLRTRWFALDLDVELGGAQVTETALIDAGATPAKLVVRRWGIDE